MPVRAASERSRRTPLIAALTPADPPAWVADAIHKDCRLQLRSICIAQATALSSECFTDAVATAYRRIAAELSDMRRFPLRIWNFVPDIQAPMAGGDRYMAFNDGRFTAYSEWLGGTTAFSAAIPTASGVGVEGDALWIHVLSGTAAGVPVENPRQIPAYRYSRRYGTRPPCFARATRFADTLFVGGTASIAGEDSRHVGDAARQTHETLLNLAALTPLSSLIDVRVHVADKSCLATIGTLVLDALPADCDVEFVHARLCRPELLVEIEGRARLSAGQPAEPR